MRAVLAAAALLLCAAPAGAATTRYVTPAGIAEGDCSTTAPCSLAYALEGSGSAAGDTVVLAPGSYPDQPVVLDRPLFVTAGEGAGRPVLRVTQAGATALTLTEQAAGAVVEDLAVRAAGDGTAGVAVHAAATVQDVSVIAVNGPCLRSDAVGVRLHDVHLAMTEGAEAPCLESVARDTLWSDVVVRAPNTRTAAEFNSNGEILAGTFEGLLTGLRLDGNPRARRVTGVGARSGIELAAGALLTDSVAVTTEDGTALLATGGVSHIVNVTAWGDTPGAVGVRATTGAGMLVRNTIARGPGGDVVADPASAGYTDECTDPAGCPAGSVTISASNFRTALRVADTGGNRSAPPRFADAALYDFHLRRGSPAIDAGNFELNVNGADRHGRYRWLGKAPDVGAFEYPSPRTQRARTDADPPSLGIVRLTERVFRVGRRGMAFSAARVPLGTTLVAVLSEEGDVVMTVTRPGDPRVLGTLVRGAARGTTRIPISGRLEGEPLPPGRYELRVVGRDRSQNLSAERVLPFRISS